MSNVVKNLVNFTYDEICDDAILIKKINTLSFPIVRVDIGHRPSGEADRQAVRALKAADFQNEFAEFDRMIKQVGNLVPQMYRDCSDFLVVLEK